MEFKVYGKCVIECVHGNTFAQFFLSLEDAPLAATNLSRHKYWNEYAIIF